MSNLTPEQAKAIVELVVARGGLKLVDIRKTLEKAGTKISSSAIVIEAEGEEPKLAEALQGALACISYQMPSSNEKMRHFLVEAGTQLYSEDDAEDDDAVAEPFVIDPTMVDTFFLSTQSGVTSQASPQAAQGALMMALAVDPSAKLYAGMQVNVQCTLELMKDVLATPISQTIEMESDADDPDSDTEDEDDDSDESGG